MSAGIYWFRRVLRLDDNRSLLTALGRHEHIVPVFILDPAILGRPDTGKARVRFLFEGLAALDADLRAIGGRLILRKGDPLEVLPRLVQECGASAVYHAQEYEPSGLERDRRVGRALAALGVEVCTERDLLLVEPWELATRARTPYTVFTPYFRGWSEREKLPPQSAPTRIVVPAELSSEPLPEPEPHWPRASVQGGEAEAERRLLAFLRGPAARYDTLRELPGIEGTSRLSAYLKFGMLSPRRMLTMLRALRQSLPLGERGGVDTVIRELAWRDFYSHILWHFPQVASGCFKAAFDTITWENSESLFAAWKEGRTGYPFIDAAMRQLRAEGWMHNRARMASASFLTKDLLIDWRWGERYFMEMLVDGDLAANNGGWQWAAGVGTDAQPYFRIFNPVSQGEKFDPDGAYVRRWVPELAGVPDRAIHAPWRLSAAERAAVGADAYPAPIVDHSAQRDRALALYKAVKENAP